MPRTKGTPKTGGRPKGTSFADKLRCELLASKVDLVAMFFKDLEGVDESYKRCELILKFMEFVYPKPKMEIAVSVKDMDPETFREMMKDGVARIRAERTST